MCFRLTDRSNPAALIHGGTSGIGSAALMLCHALGIKAYATAGTDAKCKAVADRFGCDDNTNRVTSVTIQTQRTIQPVFSIYAVFSIERAGAPESESF